MDVRAKPLLISAAVILLALLIPLAMGTAQAQDIGSQPVTGVQPVIIYVFRGDGCPYCHAEMEYLKELQAAYPHLIVRDYEIYHNEDNRSYLHQMLALQGARPSGVPVTFIGDRHWIGFSDGIAAQIEQAVQTCQQTTCIDPGQGIIPVETQTWPSVIAGTDPALAAASTLTLPLIGEISLEGLSLGLSTALIAFVDGFNPCSLWVLSLLLGLVLHSGSRQKVMIIGLTFLTVTSAVYMLFIAGLFTIFSFVGFIGWIQVAVALMALAFAFINIKDYFWYKQGPSLTISDRHKPKIYRDMRGLLKGNKSTPALIGATAVMAMGVTLVELPCTSGLPVMWTNLISANQVTALNFALLLGLYMLIFLADELLIFGTVVLTLKVSKFEEKQGRMLKLIGGVVMLALAIVMLIDPTIMNSMTNSLLIFGVAIAAAVAILFLHRQVLPHYGIQIGTEALAVKTPGGKASVAKASAAKASGGKISASRQRRHQRRQQTHHRKRLNHN